MPYCDICKEPITDKKCSCSIAHYERPLCRKHQDIAKIVKARLAEAETQQQTQPKQPKLNPQVQGTLGKIDAISHLK